MERLRDISIGLLVQLLIFGWLYACSGSEEPAEGFQAKQEGRYATEKVILLVIDGPRYADTWALATQPYISQMAHELAPQGTFFSNFRNEGPTYTLAGHTALTTGYYQGIANNGSEYPAKPSFFQHYLAQGQHVPDKAIVMASKAKLHVLADTRHLDWRSRYNPLVDCGWNGESRADSLTLLAALSALQEKQPDLMLIQFLGPDKNGHANNWEGYLDSIEETDSLVAVLWNWLQTNETYRAKTALLVTNDHGRHANGHKDGFISHGDNCADCRHISLLALGPDFPVGKRISEPYEQIDVPVTIGNLLGFSVPDYGGKPLMPLLKAAE